MENKLKIEQAISNIKVVLENFVGKKSEHIALEQSIILIENKLNEICQQQK